jgi:putative ABC transport system permease protein
MLFGTAFPGMISIMMVKAKSSDDLSAAERQIFELTRQRHHIDAKQDDAFSVGYLTQIMQTAEQSTKVMTLCSGPSPLFSCWSEALEL